MKFKTNGHIFAAILTVSLCCFTSGISQPIYAEDYICDDYSTVCYDDEIIIEEPLTDESAEVQDFFDDIENPDEYIDSETEVIPTPDSSEEFNELSNPTSESVFSSAENTNEEVLLESALEDIHSQLQSL